MIAHEEARRHAASGGDVLRDLEIEGQASQTQAAGQTANQESGQHGGHNQEEQVIGRNHGAEGHQQDGEGEQNSAAGDFVANPARQKGAKLSPGSGHGGWFDCTPGRGNRTGQEACPWRLAIRATNPARRVSRRRNRLRHQVVPSACMGGACFSLPGERSSPRTGGPRGYPGLSYCNNGCNPRGVGEV